MKDVKTRLKAYRHLLWQLAEAESIIVRDDEEIRNINKELKALERSLAPWGKLAKWSVDA
jgi:hypothetical protein